MTPEQLHQIDQARRYAEQDEYAVTRMHIRNLLAIIDARHVACHCHKCSGHLPPIRMILCPQCGNKRCPHANDHLNVCTGSNEPGQEGSAYQ